MGYNSQPVSMPIAASGYVRPNSDAIAESARRQSLMPHDVLLREHTSANHTQRCSHVQLRHPVLAPVVLVSAKPQCSHLRPHLNRHCWVHCEKLQQAKRSLLEVRYDLLLSFERRVRVFPLRVRKLSEEPDCETPGRHAEPESVGEARSWREWYPPIVADSRAHKCRQNAGSRVWSRDSHIFQSVLRFGTEKPGARAKPGCIFTTRRTSS